MNKRKHPFRRLAPLGTLGLLAGTLPAHAQSLLDATAFGQSWLAASAPSPTPRNTSIDNEMLMADEPLVVTATKTAERISDAPAAVTIITEDEIRRSAAKTVPDLLRSVPGVDVSVPNQSQENVSIRGFNDQFSNTLLVVVDGRPIYQDFYGTVFWEQEPLLLSRIKRIEIVRGPGSALYGANAFNGVINIITKTPQEMADGGTHGDATAAQGEQSSTFAEANVAGRLGGGWTYALGGGYHATAGDSGRVNGMTADSYRTPMLMADVQKDLPDGSLRLSANVARSKMDYDSIFVIPSSDWRDSNYTLTYDADRAHAPSLVRVFASDIHLASATVGTLEGRTFGLDLQQQRDLSARDRLVYGLSLRDTSLQAFLTSDRRRSRQSWSAFLQNEAHLAPQTSLFAGARLDRNSLYGSQISPRLSLVQHLDRAQTLRLSYATAFLDPSLLANYIDVTFPITLPPSLLSLLPPDFPASLLAIRVAPNTSLRPEQLRSVEAGYRRDLPGGYVGLAVFTNWLTDRIEARPTTFAPSPPLPPGLPTGYSYMNVGKGRAAGLELEAGFPVPGGLRGQFNYAYQAVTANDQSGNLSPRNKANLSVETSEGGRVSFRTDIHYVDRSVFRAFYAPGQSYPVGAYVRLDAKLGYRVGPTSRPTTFSLSATNLLGDGHREFPAITGPLSPLPEGFPQPRTAWVEVSTRW